VTRWSSPPRRRWRWAAPTPRRADAIGQTPPLSGTVAQVVDRIGEYAEAGAERLFLQILDLDDLDHLDLVAAEVLPQFA
jgi:alkanesulfonate monooxygenase SsuD/methylene tetrahydromethanopterin reductase-like flavin-dependent oxidoreductase (luciferase family)